MNKKEVGEIRRRQRRDRSNINRIYGCYVNNNQEIISEFETPVGMLPENETEKYMSLFKKTLSGSLGKSLNNISFSTDQVANREPRYTALSELRRAALEDKAARSAFYTRVIESLQLDSNYLILLGCETYDVPFKNKNDDRDGDRSDESFTYFMCAICPVKETKPNLHYVHKDATFHDGGMVQAVHAPIMGFMFPAFDDRASNIYGALYFNKDTANANQAFVENIFGTQTPTPADIEKQAFSSILTSTLGDECCIDVVQSLHEQASARLALHAESKVAEPATVNLEDLRGALVGNGVSDKAVKAFEEAFDSTFGPGAEVNLQNIFDTKHYSVTTPDVIIKTSPENAQNIEMRSIGGLNYILILAEDTVEVNGIQISMGPKE